MFFVEPVIGYRSWHITQEECDLRSAIVARQAAWPSDRATKAECKDTGFGQAKLETKHESPTRGCQCGYYAWHTAEEAVAKYSAGKRSIVGAVICWGKYVVGTKGFRAQYMRPVALADQLGPRERDLGWPSMIEGVIERYSIPLLPLDLLEEYAETWGKPMGIEFTQ